MITVLRNNFNEALSQVSDLDAINAQGGVAAWTLPPSVMKAYNPITFVAEVFYAVTPNKPAPNGKTPNFARVDYAGGSTGITFDYPVASAVTITVKPQDNYSDEERYTVPAGGTTTERIRYYANIVSISPAEDSVYMYLTVGESYDGGNYLVTSSGNVFCRDTESIDPLTLTIALTQYEDFATLSAEPYKGQAQIDVSAIVRTTFAKHLTDNVVGLADEPALATTYIVASNGTQLGTFAGINAVAQVGESADMSDAPTPLTRFAKLYRYAGYELTASILSGYDVIRVGLNEGSAGVPIEIEDRCTPPAPFYVRWINTLGGVDYWMFCKSQEYAPQVSGSSVYEQYHSDPAQAKTNRRAYAIATKNGITAGAEGVPAEAWNALQGLPFAPLIEWYNEKLGKWIGLTVTKYDGAVMSDHSTHDIEIEFELPAINTQF